MSIQVISSEAEVAKAANVSTDQSVVAVPSVSKKVSAQVAQKASAKKAVLDDLAKKEQEEEARQAQLAEAAAEEAAAEEVAQDEQAVEAAQTIAAAAETLDASAQEVAAVIADNPMMFAQAGAAAAGASGGAAAGAFAGISTTAIVAGVAVVGVAAAASSDSSSSTAATPGITPDTTPAPTPTALTVGAEAYTGTTGDDTVSGIASSLSSARTLDVTDTIDGGTGNDTLELDIQSNFSGFTTGSMKGIETVKITNNSSTSRSFDATGVSDVTHYHLVATKSAITLADLADLNAAVTIESQKSGTNSVAFASKVTDGTTDAFALNYVNTGTAQVKNAAGTVTTAEAAVTTTVAGVETLNITATGTNIVNLTAAATKTVNLSGAGSFKMATGPAAMTAFDGSASTGAIDLDLTAGSNGTSVKTGSAADRVTVNTGDLLANATLDGGDGADVLELTATLQGTVQFSMTGFETVEVGGTAGAVTFSASKTSGLETLKVLKETTQNYTIANLGASDITISSVGASAGTPTVTVDNSGLATLAVSTPATAGTTDTNKTSLTASAAQEVVLTVAADMEYTGTVTASKAEVLTITNGGEIDGATFTAGAAKAVTITNTKVASDFDLAAAKATTIGITASQNLVINGASDVTAVQDLTITTSGTALVDFATNTEDLTALASATLSGTGQVKLNNLGSTTQDYALTVSATGLNANLTIGTVDTLDNQIRILGADVLGNVSVAAIGAGDGGDVEVDFSNVAGTVGLLAIVGDSVTINLGNALGAITYGGTISVEDTFTWVGSGLKANDLATQDVLPTGTSFTASLTGGIDADTIDITTADANNTVKVTLTGDLSLGSDVVIIDVSAEASANTIDVSGLTVNSSSSVTIKGTDAADTIKLSSTAIEKVQVTTGATVDAVTGFSVGSGGDQLSYTIGTTINGTTTTMSLSNFNGDDISAGATSVTIAEFDGGASATASTSATFLKLTTAATSFAGAIGTNGLEVADFSDIGTNEGVAASWYDSTNSVAVFGFLVNATGATNLSSADTFVEMARLSITSTDYGSLHASNVTFFA